MRSPDGPQVVAGLLNAGRQATADKATRHGSERLIGVQLPDVSGVAPLMARTNVQRTRVHLFRVEDMTICGRTAKRVASCPGQDFIQRPEPSPSAVGDVSCRCDRRVRMRKSVQRQSVLQSEFKPDPWRGGPPQAETRPAPPVTPRPVCVTGGPRSLGVVSSDEFGRET